jgi:hypothetical protein
VQGVGKYQYWLFSSYWCSFGYGLEAVGIRVKRDTIPKFFFFSHSPLAPGFLVKYPYAIQLLKAEKSFRLPRPHFLQSETDVCKKWTLMLYFLACFEISLIS